MARGDLASAEPILREAAKALRDSGGPAYARLSANNYLGQLLMEQRRYGEAIGVMREALVAASAIGPHLADATPAVKNNLALLLLETGELAEARQLAEDGLAMRQKALPPEHLEIASSMYVLGAIRARSGDAEPLARESLRMREAQLPATDERVIESRKLVEEIDRVLAGGN
jgi:tetratricopeptide (TPR) repeat protein